jgi:hypothetical protein
MRLLSLLKRSVFPQSQWNESRLHVQEQRTRQQQKRRKRVSTSKFWNQKPPSKKFQYHLSQQLLVKTMLVLLSTLCVGDTTSAAPVLSPKRCLRLQRRFCAFGQCFYTSCFLFFFFSFCKCCELSSEDHLLFVAVSPLVGSPLLMFIGNW